MSKNIKLKIWAIYLKIMILEFRKCHNEYNIP